MNPLDTAIKRVREILTKEQYTPLKISVMGQTGVGKSSLINALFNANLEINPVRPTTKEITAINVPVENAPQGTSLIFYDLPGIGASEQTDAANIRQYQQMMFDSDIVLWAIHSDSRSFTFDLDALNKVFGTIDKKEQAQLISRITFILTKADLLSPPPWILAKLGKQSIFVPQEATEELLELKEQNVQEYFILPYKELLRPQTYYEGVFNINDPHIRFKDHIVTYEGILDKKSLQNLKERFPQHSAIFDRLHDNYRVISCSSRYRFNLDLLIRVIIAKLRTNAVTSFGNFYQEGVMDRLLFEDAKQFFNLLVLDQEKGSVIFDPAQFES